MFEYLNTLNPEQREAATTIQGPLLIIAGAGSGKTTTLINRVAYMIDNNIDPTKILLLTFTNEAARNMIEKAAKNSNQKCELITACTYHSFCAKLLRQYGQFIHIPNNFVILSQTDAEDALKIIRSGVYEYSQRGFPTNKIIVSIFSKAINTGAYTKEEFEHLLEQSFNEYVDYCELLMSLLKDYIAYKQEHCLLDYDDLLYMTNKLLKLPNVLDMIQEQYQYIMVDEYQDTNYLQENIVFALSSKYHNLAVVGDDYQSIYAFRGSDINNIIDFPKKLPNCKQIILDTNYRSTKEIIDVANIVMDNHAHFGYKKQMKDNHSYGKQAKIIHTSTDKEEAFFLLEKIQKKQKQGVPLSQIAIIARTGLETAYLEGLLNKNKISYVKKGGPKFFELETIRDMLAYLKLTVNYENELSWSRVLDVIPGIGDHYSSELTKKCKEKNFLIHNSYQKCAFYPYLIQLQELYQNIFSHNYSFQQMFQIFSDYYFLLRQYTVDHMNTKNEDHRTQAQINLKNDKINVETLWDIASHYEKVEDFLDELILDPNKNENLDEDKENQVVITTIHSSKGLEWDNVYIMNCVEGYIPSVSEHLDKETFDEDLRCFYVALTRAKKELSLIVPDVLNVRGKTVGGLTHICKEASKTMKNKTFQFNSIEMKSFILDTSYSMKDELKKMKCRWNPDAKKWMASYDIICQNPKLIQYISKDYHKKDDIQELTTSIYQNQTQDLELDERE